MKYYDVTLTETIEYSMTACGEDQEQAEQNAIQALIDNDDRDKWFVAVQERDIESISEVDSPEVVYVEKGGMNCIKCQGEALEYGSVEMNCGSASQAVYCTDCGSSWGAGFTLSEVHNFVPGDGKNV